MNAAQCNRNTIKIQKQNPKSVFFPPQTKTWPDILVNSLPAKPKMKSNIASPQEKTAKRTKTKTTVAMQLGIVIIRRSKSVRSEFYAEMK